MRGVDRGQLGSTLGKLRDLADAEYARREAASNGDINSERGEVDSRDNVCRDCSVQNLPQQFFATKRTHKPKMDLSIDNYTCIACLQSSSTKREAGSPSLSARESNCRKRDMLELTGAERLMRNFRELLWYWQEYYLRRGRDRLSIEFSTHIPYKYWLELVGIYSNHSFILLPLSYFSSMIIRAALPRQRNGYLCAAEADHIAVQPILPIFPLKLFIPRA